MVLGANIPPEITQYVFDKIEQNPSFQSEHYDLASGSALDGRTFQIKDGSQLIDVSLCGLDQTVPALDGAARDHLSRFLAKGNGRITLVPVSNVQNSKMVAEAFVLLPDTEEEIHLNSQLLLDGMATLDAQEAYGCPNQSIMQRAAAQVARPEN